MRRTLIGVLLGVCIAAGTSVTAQIISSHDFAAKGDSNPIMGMYSASPDSVDDLDNARIQTDSTGHLITVPKSTVSPIATDDSAASAIGNQIMCHYEASRDSVDDGDAQRFACTADGLLIVSSLVEDTDDSAAGTVGHMLVGHYEATPDDVNDNDAQRIAVDKFGNIKTTPATADTAVVATENDLAVTTSAAACVTSLLTNRKSVTLRNTGAVTMCIGEDNGITCAAGDTNGFDILPGEAITLEIGTTAMWCITAASATTVSSLQVAP